MSARLGDTITEMYEIDKQIEVLQGKIRKLNLQREKLQVRLLYNFEDDEIEGTRTKLIVASVKTHQHPSIKDRSKVNKYIIAKRDPDLLQGRIMSTHYFELLEDGIKIPGVEIFKRQTVSLTKRR